MSGENLELVRSIYDRWEAGDFTSVDWADPGIEYSLPAGTDPEIYHGVEAMGRAWADWLNAFDDFSVHVEEMIEAGDLVVVMVRFGGRGKESGLSMEATGDRGSNLFEIRDGKVVRLILYGDRDQAMREAGI